MWNLSAKCTLLIYHWTSNLKNLEPRQSDFVRSICIYSLISITIIFIITRNISITLTTVSTPEALFYLLHPLVASSPLPNPLHCTNLLQKALTLPSSLLMTISKFKIVQINHDWFTGRLNRFASLSTSVRCNSTGVHWLMALYLLLYSITMADPFRTFADQIRWTRW